MVHSDPIDLSAGNADTAAEPDHPNRRSMGLAYWMDRVLDECDRAGDDLAEGPVHDLRVALRRCRTIADGVSAIDPDKAWRAMKREGKRLFRRLGALRDVQVMQEWVPRLGLAEDPAASIILADLARQEVQLKQDALRALEDFDRQKWRSLIRRLDTRARRVPLDGMIFQLNALEARDRAYEFHKQALRNRSAPAFHRLRIALKKFRYTVENFLPRRHGQWGPDLKNLQDWLGDMHDLAVLFKTAIQVGAFSDRECLTRWRTQIEQERRVRLEHYRLKMSGRQSLWLAWRAGLPPPGRLRAGALETLGKRASFCAADMGHARCVRRLALQLYDGLGKAKARNSEECRNQRAVLHAAAILHQVGCSLSSKKCNKASSRWIRKLSPPPGFSGELMLLTALVVRYHSGDLECLENEKLSGFPEAQQKAVIELSGILRLAKTLALHPGQAIQSIDVRLSPDAIVIFARGYSEGIPFAQKLAQARCLLEYARKQPILIRGVPTQIPS